MNNDTKAEWKKLIDEINDWSRFPVNTETSEHITSEEFIENLSKRYLLIPYDEPIEE